MGDLSFNLKYSGQHETRKVIIEQNSASDFSGQKRLRMEDEENIRLEREEREQGEIELKQSRMEMLEARR